MKRTLAIAFVAILLLNTMGYYVVLLGMQYTQNAAILKVLDADSYDDANTVTLKIPVAIPYMPDNTDFERVDGLFEHQGEHYRLVKQKYAQDTLTIVCIRDTERKKLDQELSNYVRTFSDHTTEHPNNARHTLSFIKDYLPQYTVIKSLSWGWEKAVVYPDFSRNLTPSFESSIIHPPERLA